MQKLLFDTISILNGEQITMNFSTTTLWSSMSKNKFCNFVVEIYNWDLLLLWAYNGQKYIFLKWVGGLLRASLQNYWTDFNVIWHGGHLSSMNPQDNIYLNEWKGSCQIGDKTVRLITMQIDTQKDWTISALSAYL